MISVLSFLVFASGFLLMIRGFWFAARIGLRANLSVLGFTNIREEEAGRGDHSFWKAVRNLIPGLLLVIGASTLQRGTL